MSNFDFFVGQQEVLKHRIKESDIEKFIALSGDKNPIHTDRDFASKANLKAPVAHGMLGVSFISNVIGNKLPGPGALWMTQTLEFISPARVGDTLTIKVTVKSVLDIEKILSLETIITKDNGELVTRGTATVKVLTDRRLPTPLDEVKPSKVAIVIGGSGGIGSEICKELALNGYKIMVSYKKDDFHAMKLEKEITEQKGICKTFKSDLSNDEEVDTLVSETLNLFGTVSHVIFCASSTLENVPIGELVWEKFMSQINVHTRLLFEITKRLVPVFELHGSGNIIALGSTVTDNPPPNWLPYVTAKSSLLGFMKALAKELGPKNIRVNVVSPSTIETSLTGNFSERSKLTTLTNTPLRRLTTAKDVSKTILFLASDDSAHITAQNIRINGGA